MSGILIARSEIKPGLNTFPKDDIFVWNHPDEPSVFRAGSLTCKHQGGQLCQMGTTLFLRCPRHGWVLNAETLEYENPRGGRSQDEYEVIDHGNVIEVMPKQHSRPWGNRKLEQKLKPYEFTTRFLSHASLDIRTPTTRIVTDPWYEGPAFTRGWWLKEKPYYDSYGIAAEADIIYISHAHSDHLNPHTLAELYKRNPVVTFVVPAFENSGCKSLIKRHGFKDVREVPFDEWQELGDLRYMILRDGTHRDDSGLLIEYKGTRMLCAVDCTNLNDGVLPEVETLFTSFAGGASGYPLCWSMINMDVMRKMEYLQKARAIMLSRAVEYVRMTKAVNYVPYAGHFTEAHPADIDIKHANKKNTPLETATFVREKCPETNTVVMRPGDLIDVSTGNVQPYAARAAVDELGRLASKEADPPAQWSMEYMDKYLKPLAEDAKFAPLDTIEGITNYFVWSGFHNHDVILTVTEASEDWQKYRYAWLGEGKMPEDYQPGTPTCLEYREWFIDFRGDTPVVKEGTPGWAEFQEEVGEAQDRPEFHHIHMIVRQDVWRHVLKHGLPWEEITIGFQARLSREPNVYCVDFWRHFQDKLPVDPPNWDCQAVVSRAEYLDLVVGQLASTQHESISGAIKQVNKDLGEDDLHTYVFLTNEDVVDHLEDIGYRKCEWCRLWLASDEMVEEAKAEGSDICRECWDDKKDE